MESNAKIEYGLVIIGTVLILAASFLFYRDQFALGSLLLLALLVLHKADALSEFAVSLTDGFTAKFSPSPEKIEEDLRENDQPITNQNFAQFSHVEAKILSILQKRYSGAMKTQIHFIYGPPDKPEFRYTPDGTLQTDDALYFFEIKYVLKREFAKKIVDATSDYLKKVYDRFHSVSGKRLVIKLVLASSEDIDISDFPIPDGIELEFFKV
jgi:hypothetical protein